MLILKLVLLRGTQSAANLDVKAEKTAIIAPLIVDHVQPHAVAAEVVQILDTDGALVANMAVVNVYRIVVLAIADQLDQLAEPMDAKLEKIVIIVLKIVGYVLQHVFQITVKHATVMPVAVEAQYNAMAAVVELHRFAVAIHSAGMILPIALQEQVDGLATLIIITNLLRFIFTKIMFFTMLSQQIFLQSLVLLLLAAVIQTTDSVTQLQRLGKMEQHIP